MSEHPNPETLLAMIVANAPALRRSGVRSVTLAGMSFELAPPDPPPPLPVPKAEEVPSDPLEDPMLYPGGRVPRVSDERRSRPKRDE